MYKSHSLSPICQSWKAKKILTRWHEHLTVKGEWVDLHVNISQGDQEVGSFKKTKTLIEMWENTGVWERGKSEKF